MMCRRCAAINWSGGMAVTAVPRGLYDLNLKVFCLPNSANEFGRLFYVLWRRREVFMGIVANVRSRAMASRRGVRMMSAAGLWRAVGGVLITLVSVDNRVDKIVDKWAKDGALWLCMAL